MERASWCNLVARRSGHRGLGASQSANSSLAVACAAAQCTFCRWPVSLLWPQQERKREGPECALNAGGGVFLAAKLRAASTILAPPRQNGRVRLERGQLYVPSPSQPAAPSEVGDAGRNRAGAPPLSPPSNCRPHRPANFGRDIVPPAFQFRRLRGTGLLRSYRQQRMRSLPITANDPLTYPMGIGVHQDRSAH